MQVALRSGTKVARHRRPKAAWALPFALLMVLCCVVPVAASTEQSTPKQVVLQSDGIEFRMQLGGGRYSFSFQHHQVIAADPTAGVLLDGRPVTFASAGPCTGAECQLVGMSADGTRMHLVIQLRPNCAELIASPAQPGKEIRLVTGGAAPAFGLADHAVLNQFFTPERKQYNTDVSGFADDRFLSGQGLARLISNFVIYPRQHFAELLVDPTTKIVHTSAGQIVQGVVHAGSSVRLYYYFGDPHQIYRQYLKTRMASGYTVFRPNYRAFRVGWEAFGALGWETNQKTVEESVDRYLAAGYPLKWAVIGSGFWPAAPEMNETTSFGMWNHDKYPDPSAMIEHLRAEGLSVMLGLRITFITTGPYSADGVAKGYFLEKDGKPEIFHGPWPKLPYYLLNAHNPAALNWYMELVKRWQAYGIDGWKEDLFGYGGHGLRDDKVDPVNDRLMEENQLVIERNGYLSSNGDLQRIEDFNYEQDQDRGPVNALALAYAGFPLVYPDVLGGTFGERLVEKTTSSTDSERRPEKDRTARLQLYMMRKAQWAALHSGMAMGEPPWKFGAETAKVVLAAALLHDRLAPYFYSNAVRFAEDGYPWTMTPLPIAFPSDPRVYGRENAEVRGYEWMIGDALLATPLYGNDYDTAGSRDIYLPAGEWMDFDTGQFYWGNQMLRNFALPVGKTPLFVGGSGTTLENHDGRVVVCIYPVATHASVSLTLPQGGKAVRVEISGPPAGSEWESIAVTDESGHEMTVRRIGLAFSFEPRGGGRYRVRVTAARRPTPAKSDK